MAKKSTKRTLRLVKPAPTLLQRLRKSLSNLRKRLSSLVKSRKS